MQAEPQKILEAAQKGDPRAIAALMNSSFQPKGVSVKTSLRDKCLSIFLEADQELDQSSLTALVEKGLLSLDIKSIKTVKLYGRAKGSESVNWNSVITLNSYSESEESQIQTLQTGSIELKGNSSRQPLKIINYSTKNQAKNTQANFAFILGLTSSIFLLLGCSGFLFWSRSVQSKALVQAQSLVKNSENISASFSINDLKAQKEKTQKAIEMLQESPQLPLLNVKGMQAELIKDKENLSAIDNRVKILEKLIPIIQETLDKFSALNSGLDVGMNYREYGQELRELKISLDRLSREPEATQHPVHEKLKDIFEDYNFAHNVWQYYLESDESNNFFPAESPYGTVLMSEYQVESREIVGTEYIYLKTALSTVWARAQQRVEEAQKLL